MDTPQEGGPLPLDTQRLFQDLTGLPNQGLHEAADYIAGLKEKYREDDFAVPATKKALSEEAFVGIWRDRTDMADSAAWVRHRRK